MTDAPTAGHKVAQQSEVATIRVNALYKVTLTCTCGRRFTTRSSRARVIAKAEALFREHIPIR